MLRLFDTARGGVFPLELRRSGEVAMYVCGPTVYGPPHLGHGRFSLAFDVLRRYLEWTGLEVTYVSNITDIDDKIIARANQERRDWREIVAECEQDWWRIMDALGVKRPTRTPHATAYVDAMIALVGDLVAAGAAYEAADGVYFAAERVADYGLLARQSLDSLRAGARVEANQAKRSPVDFALWKRAKPGEPSWESPWGPGRPGWHTECVVMSLDLLGEGFDLHGGALDLTFPHHENERAQAVAAGKAFSRHWTHNGLVEVEGTKMSKSLGNFTTLDDLIASVDPRAYRLLVLRSHYRSPIEVNAATTADAAAALERLDALARRCAELAGDAAPDPDVLARFGAAMDDDLDTPTATAVLFDAIKRANAALDAGDRPLAAALAAAVFEAFGAVGLQASVDGEVPAEVLARAAARDRARTARDWPTADAIRAELQEQGWTVEDTPAGTVVRR